MELISTKGIFELVHQSGNWVLKEELGFSPVELLVASIGGCSAYVYEKVLKNSTISFKLQNVEISYERQQEVPSKPLSRVEIVFSLQVSEADQGKAERALKLIAKNCPVIQSLDPSIHVVEKVTFV